MSKFVVSPYVTVGIQNKKLFLGFGSIQFEESNWDVAHKYLLLLKFFKSPHSLQEGKTEFPESAALLDRLVEGNFLIAENVYDRSDRFSRQKLYFNMSGMDPVAAQERLAKKRIAIVGCGGIGNQVSVHLATAGVNSFVLCDADTIELSNLSRQILFRESDAGNYKADVLSKELKARNSAVAVSVLKNHITTHEQLHFALDVDLVVVSADAGNVVNIVNQFCVANMVPYLNVGYVNDISVWGPLYIPGETGCYACQDIIASDGHDHLRDLIREINRGYQAPSTGPVNMISSGLASLDIIKFLTGYPEKAHSLNRRVGVWTHSLKVEYQDCSRNKNCKVCGDR